MKLNKYNQIEDFTFEVIGHPELSKAYCAAPCVDDMDNSKHYVNFFLLTKDLPIPQVVKHARVAFLEGILNYNPFTKMIKEYEVEKYRDIERMPVLQSTEEANRILHLSERT